MAMFEYKNFVRFWLVYLIFYLFAELKHRPIQHNESEINSVFLSYYLQSNREMSVTPLNVPLQLIFLSTLKRRKSFVAYL